MRRRLRERARVETQSLDRRPRFEEHARLACDAECARHLGPVGSEQSEVVEASGAPEYRRELHDLARGRIEVGRALDDRAYEGLDAKRFRRFAARGGGIARQFLGDVRRAVGQFDDTRPRVARNRGERARDSFASDFACGVRASAIGRYARIVSSGAASLCVASASRTSTEPPSAQWTSSTTMVVGAASPSVSTIASTVASMRVRLAFPEASSAEAPMPASDSRLRRKVSDEPNSLRADSARRIAIAAP